MIKIFKFGGASIQDAQHIQKVATILEATATEKVVVVVSAIAKTTNALEKVVDAHLEGNTDEAMQLLTTIHEQHIGIAQQLFSPESVPVALLQDMEMYVGEVEWTLQDGVKKDYDYEYDQIVAIGEILASLLVSYYISHKKINTKWLDVRDVLKTDFTYRKAKVNWEWTSKEVTTRVTALLANASCIVTQGFIASNDENCTTTLGREGSDYTASILGYCLDAASVTIWKDVPGVLNADPKKYPNALVIPQLSYQEAMELTYYGATVIHPKTLQPIYNKNIPLYVKCFLDTSLPGTIIADTLPHLTHSAYIEKNKQILLSIAPKDFSFIVEDNISAIFHYLHQYKINVNIVENSALKCAVCIDDTRNLSALLHTLSSKYKVWYNENLMLYTIYNYTEESVQDILQKHPKTLLRQQNRKVFQLVTVTNP